MAVVEIEEQFAGRRGGSGEKNAREYVRVWLVTTDDPDDGPLTVRAAIAASKGVAVGVPYKTDKESDLGALCKGTTEDQVQDNLHWLVTASYGSNVDESEQEENPLLRPTEIEFDSEQFQRPAEKDIEGEPILNSAGEQYEQPVEMDDSRPVFVFTRNEARPNYRLWASYRDAVKFGFLHGAAAQHLQDGVDQV